MANLPSNIAGQNVDEVLANAGSGSVHIPDGIYKAMFVEGALADTKSGGGKMLVLKAVITEGQYANTELTERLNIVNDNATAVKIAIESLSRIAKAVGLDKTPSNSDTLLRKPLLIEVKTEKGTPWVNNQGETVEGKDKSIINSKGYKPVLDGSTPTANAAPAATAAMPWQS
jgi:hypothetical protein